MCYTDDIGGNCFLIIIYRIFSTHFVNITFLKNKYTNEKGKDCVLCY